MDNRGALSHRSVLDPILNLPLPSPALSVCFVDSCRSDQSLGIGGSRNDDENDDESDSSEELQFRSSKLGQRASFSSPGGYSIQKILQNRSLVSCHKSGEAVLWDCGQQSRKSTICIPSDFSGLTVKRLDDTGAFLLYQRRDPTGTVSIYDVGTSDIIRKYETYSQTFCQAAPCRGNAHLIALPSRQDDTATVMDDRDPVPVAVIPSTNHGMLTSLALTQQSENGKPILACGMESGSVFFHDFTSGVVSKGECKLTKDPILALDLTHSEFPNGGDSLRQSSVVAVAGMAGDAAEIAELPEIEQGRVALVKVTAPDNLAEWHIRTRARLSTCRVDESSFGKPGISNCRFRPGDGRIFAVGGWDHRVRLFERSKGASIGILRGHAGSVNALDWAPDAMESGLLATAGSDDSRIYLWHCFPKPVHMSEA